MLVFKPDERRAATPAHQGETITAIGLCPIIDFPSRTRRIASDSPQRMVRKGMTSPDQQAGFFRVRRFRAFKEPALAMLLYH